MIYKRDRADHGKSLGQLFNLNWWGMMVTLHEATSLLNDANGFTDRRKGHPPKKYHAEAYLPRFSRATIPPVTILPYFLGCRL